MAQRVIDGFVLEEAVVLCPECQLPFTSLFLVESRKVNTNDIIEADLHRVFNDPELRASMLACCPNCKYCGWNGLFQPFPLKPELLRKEAKIEPSKKFALAVKWAREKKVHSLDIAFIALNGLWCTREAGEVDSLWLELAIYEHEKGVAASPSCPQDDGMTHLIMGELYRQHRDFEKAEAEYALAEQDRTISKEILEHVRMMNRRQFYGVIALPLRLARLYFEVEETSAKDDDKINFAAGASEEPAVQSEDETAGKAGALQENESTGDTVPLLAAINSLFSAPGSDLLSAYTTESEPIAASAEESPSLNTLSEELTKAADAGTAQFKAIEPDAERAGQEKAAAERAAVERAAAEKAAAEKAERAMLERAAAKANAEKAARAAAEKAAAEKAAAEKAAAEKAAAEKAAAEKAAAEKAAAEKAAMEKAAAEKAAAEKAAAEKAAAEKAAAEKAAAEKAAAEKAAAEKAAAEKAAMEKAAAIKSTLEKAAAERAAGKVTKPEDQIPSLDVEAESTVRRSMPPVKIKAVSPKPHRLSASASNQPNDEPSAAPVQLSKSSVTIAPAASTVSLSVTTANQTPTPAQETGRSEEAANKDDAHPARKSKAKRVKPPREDHHFSRRPLARDVAANANGWINDYGNSVQPAYAAASIREEKLEHQQRATEQTQPQTQRSTGERLPVYSNQDAAATATDAPLPGLAIDDPVQGRDYSDAINRVESYLSFSRRVYSRNWMKL